jgi:hypothetical protein
MSGPTVFDFGPNHSDKVNVPITIEITRRNCAHLRPSALSNRKTWRRGSRQRPAFEAKLPAFDFTVTARFCQTQIRTGCTNRLLIQIRDTRTSSLGTENV